MNVSLTPELEDWVQRKVETGLYRSSSEVVRDALRRLREVEESRIVQLEALRQDLELGLQQLDRGDALPFDARAVDEIKRRGRALRDGS